MSSGSSANKAVEENRAAIVQRISEAMERGGLAWAAEWRGCWSPRNARTGAPYRGINRIALAAATAGMGFDDPRWCTFNQLRDAGWHVERGTKAPAAVEFWSEYVRVGEGEGSRIITASRAADLLRRGRLGPEDIGKRFLMGKVSHVFNASQVVGIEPYGVEATAGADRDTERVAEQFLASSRCPVREGRSDQAYYVPARDYIVLPGREQFESMEGFARTALHEMCHSTMGELGRELDGTKDGYAREELVAELGSVFAAADAGLDIDALAHADMGQTFLENHAAYLQGWLSEIKRDPDALARAASGASKAADFVCERRSRLLAGELEGREPTRFMGRGGRSLSDRAMSARDASSALGDPARGSRSSRSLDI